MARDLRGVAVSAGTDVTGCALSGEAETSRDFRRDLRQHLAFGH